MVVTLSCKLYVLRAVCCRWRWLSDRAMLCAQAHETYRAKSHEVMQGTARKLTLLVEGHGATRLDAGSSPGALSVPSSGFAENID